MTGQTVGEKREGEERAHPRPLDFASEVLAALVLNLLIVQIYMIPALREHSFPGEFSIEFAHWLAMDWYWALIITAAFFVLAVFTAPLIGFRAQYALAAFVIGMVGLYDCVRAGIYRFGGIPLDVVLFLKYVPQFKYFAPSANSRDFSILAFLVSYAAWWVVIAGVLFTPFRNLFSFSRMKYPAAAIAAFALIMGFHRPLLVERYRESAASRAHDWLDREVDSSHGGTTSFDGRQPGAIPASDSVELPLRVMLEPRKPNIVLVLMESLSAHFLDLNRRDGVTLTPTLNRLISRGLYFSNFYGNGVQTIRALESILCSEYSYFGPKTCSDFFPGYKLDCLPEILRSIGYRTMFIHAGELKLDGIYGQIVRMGFDRVENGEMLPPWLQATRKFGWGYLDELLFQYAADILRRPSEKPLFLSILTVSNHHPYEVPEKRFELFPPNRLENRFHNSIHYSDYALGRFFEILEAEKLQKNTVFIITGDHSQPMKQHGNNGMAVSQAFEENFRMPLIIYAEGCIKEPKQYDFVASQVDIPPTLLHILGLREVSGAWVGEDLFSGNPRRYAIMLQPFGGGQMVMRYGNFKYVRDMGRGISHFYDLERDPGELKPLSSTGDPELDRDMGTFLFRTVRQSVNNMKSGRSRVLNRDPFGG